jgi:tetratricopeptide (TPR) repeat protein
VDLYALFNDSILSITEGKQVAASLTVDYQQKGQAYQKKLTDALEIQFRNAMTWDDDRRAAVFVTAKDTAVLGFVKNVMSMVQGRGGKALDANLLMGIAIHEALRVHGMTYTPDPKNPFSEKKKAASDFLQFPRESLKYKGGDCDDLSILYCALFESVSVETAFITIPGHIFMAFALGMNADEARKSFSKADELIIIGKTAWVPIEVTQRDGGFQQAWLDGAKEWRENLARDQARLFPVHEAWQLYSPVQLPGAETDVALPAADKVVSAYMKEVTQYINRELEPKVADLQAEIKKSQDSVKAINTLGVLYAKYEQLDKAEAEFQRILARQEYVPALLNLGNIQVLRGDREKAILYYERAAKKEPDNAKVVLATARVNHEMENYGQVAKLYKRLKELSSDLAAQYAYLDLRGEEASRAADVGNVKGTILWDEN